jgi:hypothetical protein
LIGNDQRDDSLASDEEELGEDDGVIKDGRFHGATDRPAAAVVVRTAARGTQLVGKDGGADQAIGTSDRAVLRAKGSGGLGLDDEARRLVAEMDGRQSSGCFRGQHEEMSGATRELDAEACPGTECVSPSAQAPGVGAGATTRHIPPGADSFDRCRRQTGEFELDRRGLAKQGEGQ